MLCVLLLLVFSVDIISGNGSCQIFQISSDHLNKRLINHSLGELTVSGHQQCAQECISVKGCKSIDFYKKENYCKLNDVDSMAVLQTEFERKSGFIFSDIIEWPSEMFGECVSRPCSIRQKCVSSLQTYTCVDIKCSSSALDISNGKLVLEAEDKHYFGDTAKVSCNVGYRANATEVSCTLRGKWEAIECTDTNLASGKYAQSSSTFQSYAPENGVDGSKNTFFRTNTEAVAWWRVDLGFVFVIHNISIYNRADCCQEYANGLEVEVGNTLDSMSLIDQIETFTESLKIIYPPADTEARFLSLTLRTGLPLNLAEIQVHGEPGEAMNVALGKTAHSSSTHYTFVPENGVDGYTGNFFHTNSEAVSWWRVNLGLLFEIDNVSIYNRANCCPENANGLEVEVGKTLDSMVLISQIATFTESLKTIYPPAGTQARYVSLILRTGLPLHLAEVEVYGAPVL